MSGEIVIQGGERKGWSVEEDEVLKKIITSGISQKWTEIAQIMESEYRITGKTGKQCRERWHNQLDPSNKSEGWNTEQEDTLFQLHNKIGNKWAKIAQMLPGRTDNCIKNHFYCTLRKALRRINKFINLPKNKGRFREINSVILSKVIAVAEEKFQRKLDVPEELIERCNVIKNKLIKYSKDFTDVELVQNEEELGELVEKIGEFNKAYKRKKNLKKSKNQTKSAQVSDSENQEDEDRVTLSTNLFVPQKVIHKEPRSHPVQVYQPPKPPSIPPPSAFPFTKKASLCAYLLSPSMQMSHQSILPQQIAAFTNLYPNFQFQNPMIAQGLSEPNNISSKLNQLISSQGFRPVNNPMVGEMRRIESIEYENYIKRNR